MKKNEVELPNGYKAILLENSEFIVDEIWNKNIYEKDFKINKGMNVIDIGANQGIFSLYAASKGANVYSYEPELKNFNVLCENIEKNKLSNIITAKNFAVSNKEGYLELYIPDSNEFCSAGMASVSKRFIKDLKKISNLNINKQKAKCIKLKDILKSINVSNIDLLKIDCEGAELDIIKSADINDYSKVKNIVLETHSNYSEKEIFYLIKDMGFKIISYNKLEGIFNIGYLFATREETDKEELNKPVVIIDIKPFLLCNKKYIISGSKSFSTQDKNNDLKYTWYLNGEKSNINSPSITYLFDQPGKHEIILEIIDNLFTDKDKKNIYVFSKDYFHKKNRMNLNEQGNINELILNNGSYNFLIEKRFYPSTWIPEAFVISINFIENKNSGAIFEFNNDKIKLSIDYNEIRLTDIPVLTDINFTITLLEKTRCKILWWVETSKKTISLDDSKILENSITPLNQMSQSFFYLTKDNTTFLIHKEYLPDTWSPKFIVIGFYIDRKDDESAYLDSFFEFKNRKEEINDWGKEIKLNMNDIDSDIVFSLTNKNKEIKLNILWWAE